MLILTLIILVYWNLSQELLSSNETTKIKIFEIPVNKFTKFISANLTYQKELLEYKNIIFNTSSLTFSILEKIKLIELKINMKDTKIVQVLVNKSNKLYDYI